MESVIACVDGEEYSAGVRDYAGWAAQRLSIPMEFLHAAMARQRHRTLVDAMVEREARTGLFVIGQHSHRTLNRAMRVLQRPILRAARSFRAPQRFAVIFDGTPSGARLMETISGTALLAGLECRVLAVGEAGPTRDQLCWAELVLRDAGFQAKGHLLPAASDDAICAWLDGAEIDLLVVEPPQSRLEEFLLGSTTLAVLRTSSVPVLILQPTVPLGRRHMI